MLSFDKYFYIRTINSFDMSKYEEMRLGEKEWDREFKLRTRKMVNEDLFKNGKINWRYFVGVEHGYQRECEYNAAVELLAENGTFYDSSLSEVIGSYVLSAQNPRGEFGGSLCFVHEKDALEYGQTKYANAIFPVYVHQVIRKANQYGD